MNSLTYICFASSIDSIIEEPLIYDYLPETRDMIEDVCIPMNDLVTERYIDYARDAKEWTKGNRSLLSKVFGS